MKLQFKIFFIWVLSFAILSCTEKQETYFNLKTASGKVNYRVDTPPVFQIQNKKELAIDSVVYTIDGKRVGSAVQTKDFAPNVTNTKLGKRTIEATVYYNNTSQTVSKQLTFLSSEKPTLYTYKIVNEYPHDIKAYTQGLEFKNDTLYESTGQYGTSSLRKTDYKTGEVLHQLDLDRTYFGEGLTMLNNKIYQLTWKAKKGFIYDLKTMQYTGSFAYNQSKEGWGLCNDGQKIYKSDGTEKIWTLNPETLAEEDYIEIYTNTSRIKSVNELEWVDGKIFANVYQQNAIAIINPKTGAVEGVINLKGLQEKVSQHPGLDVLNGIAYKGEQNRLFITGKNWDKLFEIEYIEKQ